MVRISNTVRTRSAAGHGSRVDAHIQRSGGTCNASFAMKSRLLIFSALLVSAAASAVSPRPSIRRKGTAAAATAAGLALGWSITPATTGIERGGVTTAEAWRRRLMRSRPIPLAERLPSILLVAALCGTAAEYVQALEEHGPVQALKQPTAAALTIRACDAAGSRACGCVRWISERVGLQAAASSAAR